MSTMSGRKRKAPTSASAPSSSLLLLFVLLAVCCCRGTLSFSPSKSFSIRNTRIKRSHVPQVAWKSLEQEQKIKAHFSPLKSTTISAIQEDSSKSRSKNKIKKRHKAASKKTQLRWVLVSIKKLYQQQEEKPSKSPTASKVKNQGLLAVMENLVNAKTTQQVIQSGRSLTKLDLTSQDWYTTYSTEVHEQVLDRVAKATAMTGLIHIALNITSHLLNNNHVPSQICQDAIAQTLRKGGKLAQLEQFLLQVGTVAVRQGATASPFALNIFIAALCDAVVDKTTDRSFWAPLRPEQNLQRAASWLDSHQTTQRLGLLPDSISFATVLNAASDYGNTTLAQEIWDLAQRSTIVPKIQLYNARLKSLQQDDAAMLDLWQHITSSSSLQPDRYTIDLMLVPLLRAGRIGDMTKMLDRFVLSSHADALVANAFQAFLWTLVDKGNDVAAAKAIFDMYIGPSLAPVLNNHIDDTAIRLVRPRTRHFTTLVEGYRRQLEQAKTASLAPTINNNNATKPTSLLDDETAMGFQRQEQDNAEGLQQEAWKLYELMLTSPKTQPDRYTVTVMMGICRSSTELTDLLEQAIHKLGFNVSSAVLRAAVTAYGDLGDPCSALALFANHVEVPVSIRYWNVLLGALTKGKPAVGPGSVLPLDVSNAQVNRILQTNAESNGRFSQELLPQLDGLSCWEAVEKLVNHFIEQPNSQTYCLLAKAAQNNYATTNAETAMAIFRNATAAGIPADGRFVNAVIRCFGDDLDAAITAWRDEIRQACFAYEKRPRRKPVPLTRVKNKNLLAAYHALIFVSGRALRPDIALRLVYAMAKEGLEPDETALNCYKSGKRLGRDPASRLRVGQRLRKLLNMADAYESLLFVECVKYDQRDKRRLGDKRIRIIL